MTKKDSGIAFLIMILAELVASGITLLLSHLNIVTGMPVLLALVMNQLIILVPILVFLKIKKIPLREVLNLRRIRIPTILLCIVYTGFCAPSIIFANLLTMMFAGNTAAQLGSQMVGVPAVFIVLIIGVLAPLNEEFLMRGVFNTGMRSTGRVLASAVMTGFCFGVLHLNLNQFSYAMIIGIMMVLANEAADSIFPSVIFHMCVNVVNSIVMVNNQNMLAESGGDVMEVLKPIAEQSGVTVQMLMVSMIVVYGILAVFGIAMAVLLLLGIAGVEGRFKEYTAGYKFTGEKKESLWSVWLIIAVVLGIGVMIVQLF